jgi:hypothetical protein
MTVKEYLGMLPNTADFLGLTDKEIDAWIFQAQELLNDHYSPYKITPRAIALQTLYMYEGDNEEIAMLRRQGVQQFTTEGMSITLLSAGVSPLVIDIMNRGSGAGVGSLI